MSIEYLGNIEFDITKTIKDYDYTKRSVFNLNRVIDSTQFEELDSEMIFSIFRIRWRLSRLEHT